MSGYPITVMADIDLERFIFDKGPAPLDGSRFFVAGPNGNRGDFTSIRDLQRYLIENRVGNGNGIRVHTIKEFKSLEGGQYYIRMLNGYHTGDSYVQTRAGIFRVAINTYPDLKKDGFQDPRAI